MNARTGMNPEIAPERPRARCLWAQGDEHCQDVYQTHSTGREGSRCYSLDALEEAGG